jgi:hypothetical protein
MSVFDQIKEEAFADELQKIAAEDSKYSVKPKGFIQDMEAARKARSYLSDGLKNIGAGVVGSVAGGVAGTVAGLAALKKGKMSQAKRNFAQLAPTIGAIGGAGVATEASIRSNMKKRGVKRSGVIIPTHKFTPEAAKKYLD